MNRRNFLRILAGAAATPAVTYFLPPIGGWKSDVIVKPNEHLAMEMVRKYRNIMEQALGDRIYFATPRGIYENGLLISEACDPDLWVSQEITLPSFCPRTFLEAVSY